MQLIHTQNEGIINAVKNSANIRFLAKVANMLKPEDIKKERKRFTEDNISADNDSGMIIYFHQIYFAEYPYLYQNAYIHFPVCAASAMRLVYMVCKWQLWSY